MQRFFHKISPLVLTIFIGFFLFGCKAKQEEKTTGPATRDISIKETTPVTVVYFEKKAPYSGAYKTAVELFKLMEKKNIKPISPMGICHE